MGFSVTVRKPAAYSRRPDCSSHTAEPSAAHCVVCCIRTRQNLRRCYRRNSHSLSDRLALTGGAAATAAAEAAALLKGTPTSRKQQRDRERVKIFQRPGSTCCLKRPCPRKYKGTCQKLSVLCFTCAVNTTKDSDLNGKGLQPLNLGSILRIRLQQALRKLLYTRAQDDSAQCLTYVPELDMGHELVLHCGPRFEEHAGGH